MWNYNKNISELQEKGDKSYGISLYKTDTASGENSGL